MKKFLIVGNMNAITYKEIFPLIKNNELWAGFKPFAGGMDMIMPSDVEILGDKVKYNEKGDVIKNIMGCIWFTNLEHQKKHKPIELTKHYSPEEYPKYDNYDAINVDKVKDIPCDYNGIMGVPISFLDKYCPEQFEIIKSGYGNDDKYLSVNGKYPYFRILIKRK